MVIPTIALLLATVGATPGRAEYARASKLYAQQKYEQALPWFEKAYARSKRRPSVIFGLAQCERRLGMLDEAEIHLEEFLEVAPARARGRGRRLLAEVRAERLRRAAATLERRPRAPPPAPPPPRDKVATLPAPPPPAAPPAPKPWEAAPKVEAPAPEEDSILSSPVFWAIAGALVVAGGVTAGVLLTRGGPAPYGGSTGEVFEP